ncbi:MAG: septum formation initiator family protein [Desulfococcaceae bacterium]|jgi:cell division protein FtsL|nr:septum formation initiator family protein [Desulfococcaceae bacterium]
MYPLRKKNQFRLTGTWMMILLIFISQLLFYTWCRVQCMRLSYEISRETDNYDQLLTIENRLKIELERLGSPERIAQIARKRLGLVSPAPHQIIEIPYRDNAE